VSLVHVADGVELDPARTGCPGVRGGCGRTADRCWTGSRRGRPPGRSAVRWTARNWASWI